MTATGVLFTAVEFKPVPSISDVGIVERMVWQEGGRALVGRVRSRDCNRKRPHLKSLAQHARWKAVLPPQEEEYLGKGCASRSSCT